MRIILTFLFIVILNTACDYSGQKYGESVNSSASTNAEPLAHNVRLHKFSDAEKQDTFKITLLGDSPETALVKFEIVSSNGEVIYKDEFESNYLFDYNLQQNATSQERNEFILARINTFFDDENFITPAIKSDQIFDPNYSDEKVWNAVKQEAGATGFHYQLGKEDGRWIAYLKQQDKVALYFNCC